MLPVIAARFYIVDNILLENIIKYLYGKSFIKQYNCYIFENTEVMQIFNINNDC
jgi:hypothetical protein